MKHRTRRAAWAALLAAGLVLGLAGSAQAKLVGEYTVFQQCPYSNEETNRCLYSVTKGGEFVLGSKKVPIVNPATLQGGYTEPVEEFSKLIAAKNGETLSKTPEPVPGGLIGLVPPEESPQLIKELVKLFTENGFTGVNSTLELAKPVSEVRLSEVHLAEEEEVALKMPVKVHLENPLLGSNCYVGSSSSPIVLELTTGSTSPPPPNTSITGTAGKFEFLEENKVLRLSGAQLVDNAWSAPGATGCGGFLIELLLDPVIDASSGLPSAAGHNSAVLENDITIATAVAVRKNDATHP